MPFSEKIKQEVRKLAAFQCCMCRETGIDIHHIIPEANKGPSTIDNAAPLCQNCHDRFGDNPKKRKQIKEMRDYWYDVVKERDFGSDSKLDKIDTLLSHLQEDQNEQLAELKSLLEERLVKQLDNIKKAQPENIKQVANETVTATRLADHVHANVHCSNCNTSIGLLVGTNVCPNCGQSLD